MNPLSWSYKDLKFKGYSMAGQTTSIVFENAKICFDIGPGDSFHLNSKLFCLSHLHADHGAGINFVLSQRSLYSLPKATIMLPEENIENVEKILRLWMDIEGFEYQYELIPSHPTQSYALSSQYLVKCFPTTHRVSSSGYIVYECKKRLKQEYRKTSQTEIINLRKNNVEIEEKIEVPIVAFTGDTQIEFLKAHPDVLKAKVLFMECTYIDEKRNIDQARTWGHIHLDEWKDQTSIFNNEHISIIHLSARYSTPQAQRILKEKLPQEFLKKMSLFPRPF